MTSTQKSLSSSHDPGWNDPPKWAFSPTPAGDGGVPSKRMLNKRVAFPLNSASPTASLNNAQGPPLGLSGNLLPPVNSFPLTSAPHRPFSTPSGKNESQHSNFVAFDKNGVLEETIENFEAVMSKELQFSNKIEEVRRRFEILKIMWKEDKLKEDICDKVLKISQGQLLDVLRDKFTNFSWECKFNFIFLCFTALKMNDVEAADKIHVSLMMENAASCNTWISGIRHMILELREKPCQANAAVSHNLHPYLLPQAKEQQDST